MPLHKKLRVMAAKVESTAGTAESLTATEGAFNAYNVIAQPSITVEERTAQGSLNRLSGVSGARQGTISFSTDIGWDGTTTMPSWASVLLPMCGVVESSQVYTPRSEAPGTNVKTGTIAVFQAGKKKQIHGAVGNARVVLPTGMMGRIDWEFTGIWDTPTDTAIITPTYPTALPIKYSSATTTYSATAICNKEVTVDIGNVIQPIECESTASGFKYFMVTDRYPKATINPESALVATLDWYGNLINNTEGALSIALDGPSDSTITIAAPKAQVLNAQESDRNGIEVDDIELGFNKNGASADQEFSITFAESS